MEKDTRYFVPTAASDMLYFPYFVQSSPKLLATRHDYAWFINPDRHCIAASGSRDWSAEQKLT